ncbi:DUF2975 domain-containing protein [Agromyces cerinus]|uniref:DUF2975 domain-containing protein n=1 Tax=Agromyces cerinus subsp. cerinus TaxID=232089 RepID=A0A1N6F8Z8_9MICO|nr:DUF2975 domain-containing protein [Agromyces cerinus]SIN91763.1 Protein of unknown function [Agromyces cerinus subsp. cerinus]
MDTTTARSITRSDAVGLWLFMAAGAIIAVWGIMAAVLRIIEIAPNRDVSVAAEFAGTPADAPIGPGGSSVEVALDQAVLTVPALPGASWAALIAQQVIAATTIGVVVVCLLMLCWAVMRNQVFSGRNTALVAVAGITGTIGFAAVPFFGNMAANGAFTRLSDGDFDNVVMSVDLMPLFFLAFVAAMAATVFTVGDRLRRDTEGLV